MKFGGPLGVIRDPVSGALLNPRFFGEATLADPSLESRATLAIKTALAEHFVNALANGASPPTVATAPDLAATIARAASESLGTPVTIVALQVTL